MLVAVLLCTIRSSVVLLRSCAVRLPHHHLSSRGSITVTRGVGANPEVQNEVDLTTELFFGT